MKHGKNPTLRQKKLMQAARLNKDTTEEMIIQNRITDRVRMIRKELYK